VRRLRLRPHTPLRIWLLFVATLCAAIIALVIVAMLS
jgi:hypothetical protein